MEPHELRELRQSLGMTLQDVADYLGLRHKSQALHLETGRTKISGAKVQLLKMLRDTDGKIFQKKS